MNPRRKQSGFPRISITQAVGFAAIASFLAGTPVSAQVLFQQFYYPIDSPPAGTSWWKQSTTQLAELANLGVYAIWHPVPVKGGSGAQSMGYDPYDLYDLGSKDQKGTIATHFGTRDEYLAYIATAHANGLKVYADVVLNHCGGADGAQDNPVMASLGWDDIPDDSKVPMERRPANYDPAKVNLRAWTQYTPKGADGKPGTGRFPRNFQHFHPSATHPDRNPEWHANYFLEDFCQEADNDYVARNLMGWSDWFQKQTGVDGYRLDAVKLVDPEFLDTFAAQAAKRTNPDGSPFFMVGELWEGNSLVLSYYQAATHRQMSLFDFPLYYSLKDMTEKPAEFKMSELAWRRFPDRTKAVMFVSNHDVDRDGPIPRQKRILPYAILMAMAGQPSVFYKDYYLPEDKNLPKAIATLIPIHNRFAVGREIIRYSDDDVLVLEREKNLLAAFNDGGKGEARTVTVATAFGPSVLLKQVGQTRSDQAQIITTDAEGKATLTVQPGAFVYFVRADANDTTNPDRFAHHAQPTTQTTEFADDLDNGRLGNTTRSVNITADTGTTLEAKVHGLTGTGEVTLTVKDSTGKTVATTKGARGKHLTTHLTVPTAGIYRLEVSSPGTPTIGYLTVTYTAPRD